MSKDTSVDNVKKFAGWLRSHNDIDKSKIGRRRLLTLYAEFCEYFDVSPLSQGRFDKALTLAGFQKRRLSTPGRPWVYALPAAGSSAEVKPAVKRTAARPRKQGE